MSHEIRTPMNGVLGMATLLSQTPLSKEQSEYVATVQASGEHLLTVLNDILDYSKQESGSLELESQTIDLVSTVEQAVELSFRKEDKLQLIMDIQHGEEACPGLSNVLPPPSPAPPALPQMVVGDVTRLRQVVVNIVSNACKFTTEPGGSIRISIGCANRLAASVGGRQHEPLSYEALEALVRNGDVSREYWQRLHGVSSSAQPSGTTVLDGMLAAPSAEHMHTRFLEVQVSVADSGIGIPKSKLHKLFKAFSQLDVSTTREYGGTGLGLAISAKLVQLMGGQMWCESEEGHGATFSFTFITPVVTVTPSSTTSAAAAAAGASVITAPSSKVDVGPLVCRRLQLTTASPRLVLLASSAQEWSANLERQIRRWGLDVRSFASAVEAAAWFRQQDPQQMAVQLAAVLQDYTAKAAVHPSPGMGSGSLTRNRSLSPRAPTNSAGLPAAPAQRIVGASSDDAAQSAAGMFSSDGTSPADVHSLAQSVRLSETKANASMSASIFYVCSGSVPAEETLQVEDLAIKWVRKPLLLSKLRSMLQACVLHKTRSPAATPAAPARRLAEALPVSILVVEDNRINMKLALKMLQNMGFQPAAAYNGAEAVATVVEQRQHFDLIFMDMVMPVKDGLAASEEILQHYSTQAAAWSPSSGTPPPPPPPVIIAMTASAMEADRKSCQAAGMVDFCAKPVNLSSLREKIEVWAGRVTAARNSANGTADLIGATGPAGVASAALIAAAAAAIPSLPATGAGVQIGSASPRVAQLLKPRVIVAPRPSAGPSANEHSSNGGQH